MEEYFSCALSRVFVELVRCETYNHRIFSLSPFGAKSKRYIAIRVDISTNKFETIPTYEDMKKLYASQQSGINIISLRIFRGLLCQNARVENHPPSSAKQDKGPCHVTTVTANCNNKNTHNDNDDLTIFFDFANIRFLVAPIIFTAAPV